MGRLFLAYIPVGVDDAREVHIEADLHERLSTGQLSFAATMAAKFGDVDWDVSESSFPVAVTRRAPKGSDLGRETRVKTTSRSRGVFYAQVQRRGPAIWARFVPASRKGRKATHFTLLARPFSDGPSENGDVAWLVRGAFAGKESPHFPEDPFCRDRAASIAFWREHAIIDGNLPYKKETVTKDCPW